MRLLSSSPLLPLSLSIATVVQPTAAFTATAVDQFCGVDLNGADVGSAKHAIPDACPLLCAARNDCRAATWTKYEGGTCWFKGQNHRANAQFDASAISYLLQETKPVPAAGCAWFNQGNVDIAGFDIGHARGRDLLDCQRQCVPNANCWAVVWTAYEAGTCWFKSRANAYVTSPGAQTCVMQRTMATTQGSCAVL